MPRRKCLSEVIEPEVSTLLTSLNFTCFVLFNRKIPKIKVIPVLVRQHMPFDLKLRSDELLNVAE